MTDFDGIIKQQVALFNATEGFSPEKLERFLNFRARLENTTVSIFGERGRTNFADVGGAATRSQTKSRSARRRENKRSARSVPPEAQNPRSQTPTSTTQPAPIPPPAPLPPPPPTQPPQPPQPPKNRSSKTSRPQLDPTIEDLPRPPKVEAPNTDERWQANEKNMPKNPQSAIPGTNFVYSHEGKNIVIVYNGTLALGLMEELTDNVPFQKEMNRAMAFVAKRTGASDGSVFALRIHAEATVETDGHPKDGVLDAGTISALACGDIKKEDSRLADMPSIKKHLDYIAQRVHQAHSIAIGEEHRGGSNAAIIYGEIKTFMIVICPASSTRNMTGKGSIDYFNKFAINPKIKQKINKQTGIDEYDGYCGLVAFICSTSEAALKSVDITPAIDDYKGTPKGRRKYGKSVTYTRLLSALNIMSDTPAESEPTMVNFFDMSVDDVKMMEELNSISIIVLSHKFNPECDVRGAQTEAAYGMREEGIEIIDPNEPETSSSASAISLDSARHRCMRPKGVWLATYDVEYPGNPTFRPWTRNNKRCALLRVYDDERAHWVFIADIDSLLRAEKEEKYCPFCHDNLPQSHQCNPSQAYIYRAPSVRNRAHMKRLPPYIFVADFETAPQSKDDPRQEIYAWGYVRVPLIDEIGPATVCGDIEYKKTGSDFLRQLHSSAVETTKESNRFPSYTQEALDKFLSHEQNSSRCYLCYRPFSDTGNSVFDHCHYTGEVLGYACQSCNVSRLSYGTARGDSRIPCYFHNGAKFDMKFILGDLYALQSEGFPRPQVCGDASRLVSISWGPIVFLDSLSFLGASLGEIMKHMNAVGEKAHRCLSFFGATCEKGDVKHDEIFLDTLPDEFPQEWYSYLERDVLGLADAMRNFILKTYEEFKINACAYVSMPQLAWNFHLSKLICDGHHFDKMTPDAHELLRKMNVGGFSNCNFRTIAPSDSQRIFTVDQNSQYPSIIRRYALPMTCPVFKPASSDLNTNEKRAEYIAQNRQHFYVFDVEAPEASHDNLRDFPGFLESKTVPVAELSSEQIDEFGNRRLPVQIISDLLPKVKHVDIGFNIALLVNQGWIVTKIHAVGTSTYVHCAGAINKFIQARQHAKNAGDANTVASMKCGANSIYGKACFNPLRYGSTKFMPKEAFGGNYILRPDVLFYHMSDDKKYNIVHKSPKREIVYDSPLWYGLYIAALGRYEVLNHFFNVIRAYDANARLIHTATDSLTCLVGNNEGWEEFKSQYCDVPGAFKLVADNIERALFINPKQYVLCTPEMSKLAAKDRLVKLAGFNKDEVPQISIEDIERVISEGSSKGVESTRLITSLGAQGVHVVKRILHLNRTTWCKVHVAGNESFPFGHCEIFKRRFMSAVSSESGDEQ